MADIRAEQRIDAGAKRVDLAERDRVQAIVGFAPEIIGRGVEIDPILLFGDVAGRIIVMDRDAAVEIVFFAGRPAVAAVELGGDVAIAVLVDIAAQQAAVELVGVHIGQAQPTPPSRNAKRRSGKRRVTPPRNSALATACPAAAKWPIWLKVKFDGELRSPKPRPPVWKVGAILSSRQRCQTAS